MAKTEVTLAFGQLPSDISGPFEALYPEIVHETPVQIEIDPEARAISFTVGAREMSFGPANENYSVFLNGIYRMLFKAAEKSGWMSQYPTKDAQQPVPDIAPDATQPAPAAAAPAQPLPPPAPAPEPKAASILVSKIIALQEKIDKAPKGTKTAALKAKLDSIKERVAKTASASDGLYLSKIAYLEKVRDERNMWDKAHGGPETAHINGDPHTGGVDFLEAHKASTESAELIEKSGWTHEASSVWTNPKGLQTADDSRLVAQLRTGGIKRATEGDASQILEHKDNPVETLADGTQKNTEIKDETQVEEVATAKSASSATFRPSKTSTVKKARQSDAEPIKGTFATFSLNIDCPAGSNVSGTDPQGNPWTKTQKVNYGEIIGTQGADGEPVDVFLGPDTNSPWVFIVNQMKPEDEVGPGEVCNERVPDEIKVGLGFASQDEAKEAYLSMFDPGWDSFDQNIITTSIDSFRNWLETHPGAPSAEADDFDLTTDTPESVVPNTPAPEAAQDLAPRPAMSYTASVKDIHTKDLADVLTSFHDASASPMDHTSASLANLFATQEADPTRGHVASFDTHTRPNTRDAENASVADHKAKLTPTGTTSKRIAEIITADLNQGMSPDECDHRASVVGYFGSDQQTFRKTLVRLAGIAGQLVLQPNFVKGSCIATYQDLNSTHKASRSKVAYHSVASTEACSGCENCKCDSKGEKHCALFKKPIVASLAEMHSLADTVWGKSKEASTADGLNRRAVAHLASLNKAPEKSPIDRHTAAVAQPDVAESRPSPVAAKVAEVSPRAYVIASLSKGVTPSRISELVQRSVTHSASFKEAAMKELASQRGMMGFLTILPNFAGSCSATHNKHFSALTSKDYRKTAFHSVLKVSACDGCGNCIKTASGTTRCSLFCKPIVATIGDLRKVASQAFPSLAPKIANATKEELAQAAIPYLAKSLGIPEDHPSLKAFQVTDEVPEKAEELDLSRMPKVEGDQGAVEGSSKNVLDLALSASKPKTKDLEDITVKVKEAFTKGKTAQQIYDAVKAVSIPKVGKVELRSIIKKAEAEVTIEQSQSSSNDSVYTSITTSDKDFGNQLKELAQAQIDGQGVSLNDNSIDLNEFASQPRDTDEFDAIESYIK